MNTKKKTLTALLALIIILAIAGAAYQYLSRAFDPDAPQITKKVAATDFTFVDKDGNEVKLSDYFGTPIILNFWASWCGPCQREIPHFEKAYPEYKDDITFLIVDLADGVHESTDSGKAFIEKSGYTFPVYFDTKSEGAVAYSITSIPTTLFIDKDGYIVSKYMGSLTEKKLLKRIEMIQ